MLSSNLIMFLHILDQYMFDMFDLYLGRFDLYLGRYGAI